MATAKALLDTLRVTPPAPFAEQDFLNMFFREQYRPIPYVYNFLLDMLWRHPENVQLEKAKAVHYCAGGSKPWRYTGKEANMDREDIKMFVKKWWDIYNDDTLNFKGPAVAVERADAGEMEAVTKPHLRAATAEAATAN